jgi:hypothetical protein
MSRYRRGQTVLINGTDGEPRPVIITNVVADEAAGEIADLYEALDEDDINISLFNDNIIELAPPVIENRVELASVEGNIATQPIIPTHHYTDEELIAMFSRTNVYHYASNASMERQPYHVAPTPVAQPTDPVASEPIPTPIDDERIFHYTKFGRPKRARILDVSIARDREGLRIEDYKPNLDMNAVVSVTLGNDNSIRVRASQGAMIGLHFRDQYNHVWVNQYSNRNVTSLPANLRYRDGAGVWWAELEVIRQAARDGVIRLASAAEAILDGDYKPKKKLRRKYDKMPQIKDEKHYVGKDYIA